MKLVIVFTMFLSAFGMAQTKSDFVLKTDFQDTLVTGYQNAIRIETTYDPSKIVLGGDGISSSYDSALGCFVVIVSNRSKEVVLKLSYRASSTTVYDFTYNFRVVPLSTEMIGRLKTKNVR